MPAQAAHITEPGLSEEDKKAGFILVELGPKLRNFYGDPERHGIFCEQDDRHPGGYAHVVDGRTTKVYPTPRVRMAEAKHELVQVYDRPETPIGNVSDNVANLAQMDARSQQAIADLTAENARLKVMIEQSQTPPTVASTTPASTTTTKAKSTEK